MSVSEAEEVVELLGEGGMLSLEQGVIDGTTEEGREKLKALEEEARAGKERGGEGVGETGGEEVVGEKVKEGEMEGVEVADVD